MSDQSDELTLKLLGAVGAELDGDAQKEVMAAQRLIGEILELGINPSQEQIVDWVKNADYH